MTVYCDHYCVEETPQSYKTENLFDENFRTYLKREEIDEIAEASGAEEPALVAIILSIFYAEKRRVKQHIRLEGKVDMFFTVTTLLSQYSAEEIVYAFEACTWTHLKEIFYADNPIECFAKYCF